MGNQPKEGWVEACRSRDQPDDDGGLNALGHLCPRPGSTRGNICKRVHVITTRRDLRANPKSSSGMRPSPIARRRKAGYFSFASPVYEKDVLWASLLQHNSASADCSYQPQPTASPSRMLRIPAASAASLCARMGE